MIKGVLQEKKTDNKVRCNVCQRRCLINCGGYGYCKTRVNKDGEIYSDIYGEICAVNIDPVEKKPVYHFKPGSRCLSLGTIGCNFRCRFCQNWHISYLGKDKDIEKESEYLKPDEAVKIALKTDCAGVAFTYNEPTIWLEYCLDSAKMARKNNLYTCFVTNGYATKQAIDLIAANLSVYRVDLKSFNDEFYRKLIGISDFKVIYENTKYVKDEYPEVHIECVTNIIPGWNDDDEQLKKIANFMVSELGEKTPWHVTRYYPVKIKGESRLLPDSPTPMEILERAYEIGKKEGIQFVYLGNVETEEKENTYCPKCGSLNIKRSYLGVEMKEIDEKGRCSQCGEDLNIKM